jgi:hypothetical protein
VMAQLDEGAFTASAKLLFDSSHSLQESCRFSLGCLLH